MIHDAVFESEIAVLDGLIETDVLLVGDSNPIHILEREKIGHSHGCRGGESRLGVSARGHAENAFGKFELLRKRGYRSTQVVAPLSRCAGRDVAEGELHLSGIVDALHADVR